jgi:exopolysaccharide production protein ExoZ
LSIPTDLLAADTRARSSKLQLIESFRGIAALLVLLLHTEVTVAKQKYFASDPLHGLFEFGAHGVDFFFVLSGFIITYAHWSDLGRLDRVRPYLRKRFLRIYPPLWALTIPFILVTYAAQMDTAPQFMADKLSVLLTSVFLIPSNLAPIPVVVWTLKHEVFFYLLFVAMLVRPIVGACLFAIWGGICLFDLAAHLPHDKFSGFFVSPYNLEFLAGICCAWVTKKARVPLPALVLLAGLTVFCWASVVADRFVEVNPMDYTERAETSGQLIALYTIASVLLILGAARLDGDQRMRPPRFLLALGAASYSIYLVHWPVVSLFCKVFTALNAHVAIAPLLAMILIAIVALISGFVFHRLVEKPLVATLSARIDPRGVTR